MDHMVIRTGFMKNLIAKIMKRTIKKKLGYEVDLDISDLEEAFGYYLGYATISDLEVTFDDGTGKAVIHLNAKATMDKTELKKMMKGEEL